jgi:hypothetical protein
VRLYHLPRHPLDPRRSAQISTRRAKVRQKFVAFLDDMTERESRSGIPGQATRCEDVAREQGVDEAHARSRVRPVRESPRQCAPSRPVAPRWQPPIHCGAPDKRIFPVSD